MKRLTSMIKSMFPEFSFSEISEVVMDSRKITKDSLFFAIQGGNAYVEEALEKGAALVIADRYEKAHPRVIQVLDTISCMQEMARQYRKLLDVIVIAITGSNGKTTTKDICHSILSKSAKAQKTEGNYNNHIGLPFTLLNTQEDTKYLVLELGMSSLGEIDLLAKISCPDYGIITNIGDSHLEYLKHRDNVFRAKMELAPYIPEGNFIVSGDDTYLKKVQEAYHVGYEDNNEDQILDYRREDGKSFFTIGGLSYHIPLEGRHNVLDAALAIRLAQKLGLSPSEIQKNLEELSISPMRFQKIVRGESEYINDAYNASPLSMLASLRSFEEIEERKAKKFAVLGDMLELGEEEIRFHRDVLEEVKTYQIDEILLYGPRMKKALQGLEEPKIKHFETKEDLKSYLSQTKRKKVLLKASRGMKLEEIIEGEE